MLSDSDIARLGYGRIIKAAFYKSSGKDAAGPHYAVILDSDEEVKEHDSYFVVVISHDDTLDPQNILPVPPRTGLSGYVQCGWLEVAHLAGITEVGPKLNPPEMLQIIQKVREAMANKKRSTRS